MKKIAFFLLFTACATTPHRPQNFPPVTVIGVDTAKVKSPSLAELTEEDWKLSKDTCITHLYQCQFNDKGEVTTLKELDASEPTFQADTEEALRSWRFEGGKAGTCFAQMIYEKDQPTRVLLVPKDMAQTMVSNLAKNRAVLPKTEHKGKSHPTALHQPRFELPRELALKGQSAYIVVNFDLDPEGVPQNIKVIDDEPQGVLEANVLKTLKNWRYSKLADEPNSFRNTTVSMTAFVPNGQPISTCDMGLKLNRLAQAQLPPQENTTGPRQAPNPSLK